MRLNKSSARKSFAAVVFCFLFGCESTTKPPISIPEMSSIMQDLLIAENYSMMANLPDSNGIRMKNIDTLAYYYNVVLRHHDISLATFEKYLDWYYDHPVFLDSVGLSVADSAGKYKPVGMKTEMPLQDTSSLKSDTAARFQNEMKPVEQPEITRPQRNADHAESQDEEAIIDIKKRSKQIRESLEKVKKAQ